MKRFKSIEANTTIELAIEVESYIKKLDSMFERAEVEVEEYLIRRNTIENLLEKNKELIKKWKGELNE